MIGSSMVKSATYTVAGRRIVETTRNCIRKSLTDEVHDVALETISDQLDTIRRQVTASDDDRDVLVDYLKYYIEDVLAGNATGFSVIADDRNNTGDVTESFVIDISFTASQSLIPTKITYVIHYQDVE